MDSPFVSVVMSVFNGSKFLEPSLRSILDQSDIEFELIVINDGSSDQTQQILDEYAASDSRVRAIHQENTGLTRSLIKGVSIAKGEFIARQDADDLSLPDRLSKQASILQGDPGVGFVSCSTKDIGPDGEFLSLIERPKDSHESTRQLLDGRLGPPAHGSVMFRKSVYDQVGGYRPEFYYAQDADLWLRMAEHSRVDYVDQPGYVFRRHENSITGSRSTLQEEFGRLGQACRDARRSGLSEDPLIEMAAELTDRIRRGDANVEDPLTDRARSQTNYLIGSELLNNDDPKAGDYFRKVIASDPWHVKARIKLLRHAVKQRFGI